MDINLQPIADAWLFLARALAMTLFISVLSTLFGFAIGVVVGGLRTYGGRVLNDVLSLYVDSMRAIPLLVVLREDLVELVEEPPVHLIEDDLDGGIHGAGLLLVVGEVVGGFRILNLIPEC